MKKTDTYYGVEVTPEIRAEIDHRRATKKHERSNAGKVMRRFANKIKPIGFKRKSTWFARETDLFAQFIHIHKYTFGPYFRMHYGIRVLNEDRDYVVLGGPSEDSQGLEFGTDDGSLEQCAEAMYLLVMTKVERWFENQTAERLLEADSCLYPEQRDALRRALAGQLNEGAVQRSRELLGLQ